MVFNTKGQEMSISTIVVIVLAIIVLVVLVYGFTVGWGNLYNQLTGFTGGEVNVQTIVQSCQIACSTNSAFDYCSRERTVVFDTTGSANADNSNAFTCLQLQNKNVGLAACGIDCSGFASGKTCESQTFKTEVCGTDARCEVRWVASETFSTDVADFELGTSDEFSKKPVDVTSQVSTADKNAHANQVCAQYVRA